MSPRRDATVPELVKKYKSRYPDLDRDLLRKLIRIENPAIFGKGNNQNYSNLKKLDRHLKKAFEGSIQLPREIKRIVIENYQENVERAFAISYEEAKAFWLNNTEVTVSDSATAVLGSGSPCSKFRVRDRFPVFQDYLSWLKSQA